MIQVRIGDRSFNMDRAGKALAVDGEPVEARLTPLSRSSYLLMLGTSPYVVTVEEGKNTRTVTLSGSPIETTTLRETDLLLEEFGMDADAGAAEREIRAPMPGLVLRVMVEPGAAVEEGQGLVVLEAMKMENELTASAAGTVAAVHVGPGDAVGKSDLLVEIDA